MCCDSAHKTLPCYTGGALLHISKNAPEEFSRCAKNAMSLFSSTSPSYLILQSLDLCSDYVTGSYRRELEQTVGRTQLCKNRIGQYGWKLAGDEPCKITVCANESGLDGEALGDALRKYSVEPEYTDPQYVVLMTSPFNTEEDFLRLEKAMREIPQKETAIYRDLPVIPRSVQRMGIRQAAFSPSRRVRTEDALGKICAMTVTCCQPSVPVAVSGEEITQELIKILKRYSICQINVL